MGVNWGQVGQVAMNAPQIIGVAMAAVQAIKGAKGPEKEAAVISAVMPVFQATEAALGKDLGNDQALAQLLSNYIAARKALTKFLEAPPVPEGIVLPK